MKKEYFKYMIKTIKPLIGMYLRLTYTKKYDEFGYVIQEI